MNGSLNKWIRQVPLLCSEGSMKMCELVQQGTIHGDGNFHSIESFHELVREN